MKNLKLLAIGAVASLALAQQPAQDKYGYLTPQFGESALAWAKQQSDTTRERLTASPTFKAVLADMEQVHAAQSPLPRYYLLGAHRYLRYERNREHPYGRIQIANVGSSGLPKGEWRTVFDLDEYNRSEPQPYTIKWMEPRKECLLTSAVDRCMIPLYANGGQQNAYIELDMQTGQIVKDGFAVTAGRNSVAWLDQNTLLIAHTTGGVNVMPSQFPAELHVWKRGTALAQARKIYELAPNNSLFEFEVAGAPSSPRIVLTEARTYTSFHLKTLTLAGDTVELPIPDALTEFGTPRIWGHALAVQLATPQTINGKVCPADTIIAYDVANRRTSVVIEPPPGVYLAGGFAATSEGFVVVGTRDLKRILYSVMPSGGRWVAKQLLVELAGTVLNVESSEIVKDPLLLEQGLTVPPRVRRLHQGAAELVDSARPQADLRDYMVDIGSAPADDGETVSYYLMHRIGKHSGPTPTILQGYGGFGVSDDPSYFCCHFGASWRSWYDRGGAFAIAAVRGGGERGGAWHLAGAGKHKKAMFDDFNAVAEKLETSGFTDPAHLGITGHSNGGILTAGALVLRPDLYAAAVIGAPVTDFSIVGHGDGGIGAGMGAEFGSWDEPADRSIMKTWDPFSNIKSGVHYPASLVLVSTTDSQVGPSHARRFIAKLQDNGATAMLLEAKQGGHDYPDEYTQTGDMAMQMSFLIDTLMKP